jgi:hypothetical protein
VLLRLLLLRARARRGLLLLRGLLLGGLRNCELVRGVVQAEPVPRDLPPRLSESIYSSAMEMERTSMA